MDKIKKEVKNAIKEDNIEEVVKLVSEAVPSENEMQELLNECLYDAARFGRYEIVKELVKKGADVNYKDPLKQSVLLQTIMSQRSKEVDNILEFLLENGSDINQRCINGQSDGFHVSHVQQTFKFPKTCGIPRFCQ